ncbi:MAG: branched-chain amino acid ABC transporter ATP-binding protein/permease [Candidatus Rokuibacteriota bacterium]
MFPLIIQNPYDIHLAIVAGIFTLLTLGLNLIFGYVGLLSLGHVAFFGLGGYTAALLSLQLNWGVLFTLPAAGVTAACAGALIGHVTLRLRGAYFVIVTLAFAEILRLIAVNWVEVTGGPMGLPGISAAVLYGGWTGATQFGSKISFYYLIALIVLLTVWCMSRLVHSRLGRAMVALREDEALAEAVGISAYRFSMVAFVLGAGLGGIAGGFYAHYIGFVSPEMLGFHFMISILVMLIVGGLGTVGGPILGSVIFTAIPEYLRLGRALREPLFGGILIVSTLVAPRGMAPALLLWWRNRNAPVSDLAAASEEAPVGRGLLQGGSSPQKGALLVVENLAISFGGLDAVKDVSFRVHQGEILSLIGPNGAGKTTILNLVTGFLAPTRGRIILNGSALRSRTTPHQVAALGMIRTFQQTRVFSSVTIAAAVMMGLHGRLGASWPGILMNGRGVKDEEHEARELAREILNFVGLHRPSDELARNLSYGEQRLLQVAIALAANPKLLLLDEPAAGMNPEETERVMRLIQRIRDLAVTILLVEHDMKLVMGVSDRIVVLDHGQVIAEGLPGEIGENPAVIEAYLGRGFGHAHA